MTEISFSVPARLFAAGDHPVPSGNGALDHGSLGRMVGRVMNAEPQERWRFAISLENNARLHRGDIEALAGTRRFADWQAGQA